MDDALITFGGEVKALGGGKVGGYLVLFGDEQSPDLAGDFFTAETDFGTHTKTATFYDHGFDATLERTVLDPEATLKRDELGVWVEAQLDTRDRYQKAILALAEAGKLGWSSGTAAHLVEREDVQSAGGKAHRIKRWPLGLDASLTPTPCEPRTAALPLKSYALKRKQASLLGEGIDTQMAAACIRTLQDALWWRISDLLYPYKDEKEKVPDWDGFKGACNEFRDRVLECLQGLRDKSTKSLAGLRDGLTFDAHCLAVRAAVEEFATRAEGLSALRATEGRSLSADRRADFKALAGRLEAVVEAATPRPTEAERIALETEHLLAGWVGLDTSNSLEASTGGTHKQ